MKAVLAVDKKAFNLLRRDGDTGDTPRSRYNFRKDVGDGLSSNVVVAVAGWVARNFPEAPVAVADRDGQIVEDHPLARLFQSPNRWYGGRDYARSLGAGLRDTGQRLLGNRPA